MDASMWRYVPKDAASLPIRSTPDVEGPKTEAVLQPAEVFGVSEELQGSNGVLYLRLADGRGWAYDADPKLGYICVREHASAQRSLEEMGAQVLVGTWRYGNKGGKYQISLTEWGQLRFDEQPPSGRRAYGFLEPTEHWFQADLNYHDGEPVGTIRLCYVAEHGAILSNYRGAGKTEWQPDLTSHKRRQALPTVLENDVGSNEANALEEDEERREERPEDQEQEKAERKPPRIPASEGRAPDASPEAAAAALTPRSAAAALGDAPPATAPPAGAPPAAPTDASLLSKSCPMVQNKSPRSEAQPAVLAARHADMMLQLLREAQRDRDVTQQRLTEVESENAQLRQSLAQREAQHHELEAERDLLLAQLRESRAQVEGLMTICRDPRLPGQAASEERASAVAPPAPVRTGPGVPARTSRPQSPSGEERVAAAKLPVGRVPCQQARSFEGLPTKGYEALQAKSFEGIPCARTAPSSPPTPLHPRIVKAVPQPVRVIQVPTPVRSNVRVASRDRPRYSWQTTATARTCSPTGC